MNVEVRWSPRMTSSGGVCSYEGISGLCSVRLSAPLLKFRPRRDLVQTLLHEMIHAYLFVTQNEKDRHSHGPEFLSHMNRINKETGAKIDVHHTFFEEVKYLQKHWWQCDGPCQSRRPNFGIVKRAMNRAPGPKDKWWSQHQSSCGGKFIKIKEPKQLKRKQDKEIPDQKSSSNNQSFFQPSTSSSNSFGSKREKGDVDYHTSIFAKEDDLVPVLDMDIETSSQQSKTCSTPFSGQGFTLSSSSAASTTATYSACSSQNKSNGSTKSKMETIELAEGTSSNLAVYPHSATSIHGERKQNSLDNFVNSPFKISGKQDDQGLVQQNLQSFLTMVLCPVCGNFFPEAEINIHLEKCLLPNA